MRVKLKVIFKKLFISLFFFSFILLLAILIFGKKIDQFLLVINSMSAEYNSDVVEAEFNAVKKRFVSKPSWGAYFATLKIPSASIELSVYQGDENEQLAKGVGHYFGSYLPGEGGSIILAAHNGVGLFHSLPQTNIGDIITLDTTYGSFQYQVYDTAIIDYKDEDKLTIQKNEEILMVYTCYPVDAMFFAQYRFVVYAKLVGESYE